MAKRRSVHEKLFRAVVVMGAALGAPACTEHGKSPRSDARVSDASGPPKQDAGVGDAAVDVILIL